MYDLDPRAVKSQGVNECSIMAGTANSKTNRHCENVCTKACNSQEDQIHEFMQDSGLIVMQVSCAKNHPRAKTHRTSIKNG